jgi:hypothetical protein
MIFSKVGSAAKTALGGSGLFLKAHAPEIMIGGGVTGFVLTVISACKATDKAHDILEAKEEALNDNDYAFFQENSISEKDHEDSIRQINRNTRWALIKAYTPTATGLAVSVILVLGGYKLINGRLVKTAAAYKILEDGFGRYRENVRDIYGEEADREMLHRVRPERLAAAQEEREKNREIDSDKKRGIKNKEKKGTAYQEIYSAVFDQYSDRWRRSWMPEQVWEYLKQKEREANDMLRIRKHIFLNEVYDLLGLERTEEGALVGWILTKNNPESKVDFGMDLIPESRKREFLTAQCNEDIWLRLHFNPDGLIYNMIDKTPRRMREALPV